MFRLVGLVLILYSCAQAGTVKTFEGTKIEKDSAAELRLYFEENTSQKDKVFAASVTKIDETELYDKTRRGPDYSSMLRDERIDLFYEMDNNLNAARSLKKVYLQAREHRISICGHITLTEKKTRRTDYTEWVVLKFTPTAGKSYEVGARTDGTIWVFWIADRYTKQIVCQSLDQNK